MFRGFTAREQQVCLALVAAIFLGIFARDWNARRSTATIAIAGPSAEHRPGMLSDPQDPVEAPRAPESREAPLMDLNTADAAVIEGLPGIGAQRAAEIVALRSRRGGLRAMEDLLEVRGIGPAAVKDLRQWARVVPPPATPRPAQAALAAAAPTPLPAATPLPRVSVNRATVEEFDTLDGIGEGLARRIVEDRVLRGPFRSVDDLGRVRGIGPKLIARNRGRLVIN